MPFERVLHRLALIDAGTDWHQTDALRDDDTVRDRQHQSCDKPVPHAKGRLNRWIISRAPRPNTRGLPHGPGGGAGGRGGRGGGGGLGFGFGGSAAAVLRRGQLAAL